MAHRYTVEVSHKELGKFLVISGTDYDLVQARARAKSLEWDKKYEAVLADRRHKEKALQEKQRAKQLLERSKEAAQRKKEDAQREIREKFEDAEERTSAARKEVEALKSLLHVALKKTVIQAKRYTNTVGVSAVRDLYGTVLNEGASKGILVTTSDYGPDSYEFAKGKPLVLLNGGNLLNLMEKHGHKAKIDLKEAKMILGEQA